MMTETPIICPHCHCKTGLTQEGLSHYVMTHDIRCPRCGEILITCNRPICR